MAPLTSNPPATVDHDTAPASRIGSAFSGYAGLDIAVERLFGGTTAWHIEFDAAPSKILSTHFDVPNFGDVTKVDWSAIEPVDVLTGGWPCQPFSHSGARRGADDPRHLFPHFAAGIEALRPKVVVGENVRGHLTLGFDIVLAEFVRLGYDVQWMLIKASDVGAPHARARLFLMATDPGQVGPLPVKGGPVAELVDEQWCDPDESLFGRELFAGSWPAAGRLVGATVYDNVGILGDAPAAISEHLTGSVMGVAHELDLLPTPRATRGGSTTEMAYALGGERTDEARMQGQVLLPTPTAAIGAGGQTSRSGARKDELLLSGVAEAVEAGRLLPTPTAAIGAGGPDFARATRDGSGGDDLQTAVHRLGGQHEAGGKLLPTPVASDLKTPPTPAHSLVREQSRALPLSERVALLPTPRASDGEKGGPNQRGSSGDFMLPSAVHHMTPPEPPTPEPGMLLPTPTAEGGTGYMSGSNRDTWRPGLEKAVQGYVPVLHQGRPDFAEDPPGLAVDGSSALLPTPTPNMLRNEEEPGSWVERRREVFERTGTRHGLPLTVAATSIADGEPLYIGDKQTLSYRDEEDDQVDAAEGRELEILTSPGSTAEEAAPAALTGYEQWGPYGPAIRRWERVTGAPAPSPTAELKPGGPQRLSPRFVEWMMGLPAGWVTDTGLSRAEQLKALGNGVVPLQAEVALRLMLAVR